MFRFVSISADVPSNQADEISRRRIVRSHARRAGGGKVKTRLPKSSPERRKGSLETPQTFGQQVRIFRISAPEIGKRKELQIRPQGKHLDVPKGPSINNHVKTLEQDSKRRIENEQQIPRRIPSLKLVPSRGRIDPFGTLSIPIGLQQQKLLYFYDTILTRSFTAFDPNMELMSYSSADPAWLNATLSLFALHYDLRLGQSISSESLFHRGEALRLVNEQLNRDSGKHISDATLGAVALLAYFDITNGARSNATMHMNGLEHIVVLRGGLQSLKRNKLLQNLVSWSDMLYSSVWDDLPRFKFGCNASGDTLTAHCVRDVRCYIAHSEFPPGFNAKMREISRTLRHLSEIKSSIMSEVQRMEFSNCIYLAEYRLLTVFDDDQPSNSKFIIARKAWQLAAYLYIHLALRELPLVSHAEQNLVQRLITTLKHTRQDFQVMGNDSLVLLLWIMFIGGAAANSKADRQYFIDHIVWVNARLGINSVPDFRNNLRKVLWLSSFCDRNSAELWERVETEMEKEGPFSDFESSVHCF